MHTLFNTSKKNLHVFFSSLAADDIHDCCSLSVFHRGENYLESDAVYQATYNKEKTRLKAIVGGNEDYTVTVTLADGSVSGSCTCPYGDVCKHLIATMLYVIDNDSDVETEDNIEEDTVNLFQQYLQTLSKEELEALVEKFAPDRFRTEVKNKFVNVGSAQNTFRKVEQKINKLLENEYLMHNFYEFNQALDSELTKLTGLEKPLQKELENLLFQTMQKINNAEEDGKLYEYDNDYGYEPSTFFNDFFTGFVASLDKIQKTIFLVKLDKALNEQSYSTFDGLRNTAKTAFCDDDLPFLKHVLLAEYKDFSQKLTEIYYDLVHHLLSYDEKTTVLDMLSERNEKRIIELAALHDTNGKTPKAIETLSKWLSENCGSYSRYEDVHSLYLDLLKKDNRELAGIAADIIANCPTHTMLAKIVSATGGKHARYELLLEQKSAGEMLLYLQKNNRLPEALELIKRKPDISDSLVNEFFKTHKMLFPDDATAYFSRIIDKNLPNTGDRYYEVITEAIRQIMKVDLIRANEHLNDIRANYKRRSNLMKMLNKL
ncbi:MAG: SWIM zinc finger family protein [Prolixibacteraceae bacterium]|nr:SWIM zinc finger family protein [Prolixibacteraceae bacterium]